MRMRLNERERERNVAKAQARILWILPRPTQRPRVRPWGDIKIQYLIPT